MDQVVLEPIDADSSVGSRWKVVIRNNDTTAYADVVAVLIVATGCTTEEAEIETWEAHTYGAASVHFSSREDCCAVAEIIASIDVDTEVVPEWD